MRASVAVRGAAGSTFDHVAREAGVSRGLLHYYFGSKERLLVEVVRRDSEVRVSKVAVSHGHAGIFVPQQCLQAALLGAAHRVMRCERVAEVVPAEVSQARLVARGIPRLGSVPVGLARWPWLHEDPGRPEATREASQDGLSFAP